MNNHMKAESWKFKRHPLCNFTIPKEIKIIERYLNGEGFASIGKELGVSRTSLWRMAKDVYNIEMYQTNGYPNYYDINTKIFENIDNEKSAYALGLMVSDGNHLKGAGMLDFNSTDRELIDNMQKCLETDKEPYTYQPQDGEINGRPIKARKELYKLRFGPKKIKEDFLKYFPARSKDTDNIPAELRGKPCTRHLIRGIFDGDGCAYSGSKQPVIYFTGKEGLLRSIKETVENNLSEMGSIRQKSQTKSFDYRISGSNNIKSLYHWLYDDAEFFLSRKKDVLIKGLDLQ